MTHQIDILLVYANEAAAQADPALAPYVSNGNWDLSHVFPGIQIWSTANDTTSTETVNGQPVTVVTHQYQPGYALILSLPGDPTTIAAAWQGDAATVLIADRDAALAGQSFILYSTLTDAQLEPMMIQPTPAGSNYPFGSP